MIKFNVACVIVAASLSSLVLGEARAQTIGYSEAVGRMAASCGADIQKYCKTSTLGGGRMQQCLDQNQASVSPSCKATVGELSALLKTRAEARAAVVRVCDADIKGSAGIEQFSRATAI